MQEIDLLILKLMAKGYNQSEVSEILKTTGHKPNSLSIIEKKLKAIRKQYNCNTNFKLAYELNKKGII